MTEREKVRNEVFKKYNGRCAYCGCELKYGCCKHRGFCYEPGKEFILNINGKLA